MMPQLGLLLLLFGASSGLAPSPGELSRRCLLGAVMTPVPALATADFLKDVPYEDDEEEEELSMEEQLLDPIVEKAKIRALEGKGRNNRDVTEKVRFEFRIARPDGSFSTRENDEDPPIFGGLDFGLFGGMVPANVALFLDFALGTDGLQYSAMESNFGSLVMARRPLQLEFRDLFGEQVLFLGDRAFFDGDDQTIAKKAKEEISLLKHDGPGLLTRRKGDVYDFGITTRAAPELDDEWTVFGKVLKDTSGLLPRIINLPVYSDDAKNDSPIARDVYKAQRDTFRNVAEALNDSRRDAVYPGKILRRVEITQVFLE